MLRITRLLAVLVALTLLAACGNKGDLVKPSASAVDTAATTGQS